MRAVMTRKSLEDIFDNSDADNAEQSAPQPDDNTSGTPENQDAPTTVEEAEEPGEPPVPQEPAKEPAEQAEPDPGVPPAPVEEIPSGHVPRAALEDERRKRQEATKASDELKDRIAELEKKLTAPAPQPTPQAPQVQPQPEPVQPPDPWTDPEGALAFERQNNSAQIFATTVALGQDMMRAVKPDYDEVEALFIDEAKRDPLLTQQMMQSRNPAKFAYEKGHQIKLMQEIGSDPTSYKEKIKAELMAEIEAENAANAAPEPTPQPTSIPAQPAAPPPPTSLAGVPSAAPRAANKVRWEGPTPLDQILK